MAVEELELRPEKAAAGLKVSAYDRSASLLIAGLLLVGAATLGIVIVFFSNRIQRMGPAIPVTAVTPPETFDFDEGELNDIAPGDENAPEDSTVDIESLLEQITVAATTDSVQMADQGALATATAARGDPRGKGTGRSRGREPRREIRFEPSSMTEYARWFDAAGFELGVLGEDNQIYYATKLSTAKPSVRVGNPDDEKRLYFNSTGGPLYPLDKQLARIAGIADKGQIILQFCSAETQTQLLTLEAEAADGRPRTDIARTVFRVTSDRSSFGFKVEDQQFYR